MDANPLRFTDPFGLVKCTCRAVGGGQRQSSGEKICTYECFCDCEASPITLKRSAGFSGTAVCIGQTNPHYTQPGGRTTFDAFGFDTESTIDRFFNPLAPPNDLMDDIERKCDDNMCKL